MDQASLVNSDIEIEAKVVSALSRAGIPVTAVDWNLAPQLDESQLIVVTRWVNERGPREVYTRILEALSDAGVYQSIPIRKLVVKSPSDPVAQKLVDELKRTSEGSIHIVRNRTTNGLPEYTLVFAPYVGSGGPIPSKRLTGNADLRTFLERQLRIHPYVADQALTELGQTDSATIFNVQLSLRRARKLNLAA
jgi:hypothetical protein